MAKHLLLDDNGQDDNMSDDNGRDDNGRDDSNGNSQGNPGHIVNMGTGQLVVGTPHDDNLFIHPGDTAFGLAGDDTITAFALIGTGGSVDRAFVFGGPGNDTIIDNSISREPGGAFPLTAFGGPGDDTFVATVAGGPGTFFTGGPGHNTFEFSAVPLHGGGATITDFSQHDAILIDVDPAFPATITFTNNAGGTEVAATTAAGASVFVELQGTFDTSQFHVTNDGMGHDVITFGHSDFHLV